MKTFRWLAAGAVVTLLALLLLVWIKSGNRAESPARPELSAAPGPSPVVAQPAAAGIVPVPPVAASEAAAHPFQSWIQQYAAADAGQRAALLSAGEALAKIRRAEMAQLIRTNPEQALQQALPYELRKQLPESVEKLIEQPVRGRGNLKVMGALPLAGSQSDFEAVRRELEVKGQKYKAYTYGSRRHLRTQNGLSFHGIAVGPVAAFAPEPLKIVTPAEAEPLLKKSDPICSVTGADSRQFNDETFGLLGDQLIRFCHVAHATRFNQQLQLAERRLIGDDGGAAGYPTNVPPGTEVNSTQGAKDVLFIRLRFPDDPTDPISEPAAYALMNSVNQFYVNSSYNTLSMNPTVTPLVMVTHPKEWYADVGGEGQLLTDGREAARLAGFDYRDYDLDALAFTTVRNFDFGGLAFVGARGVWLQSLTAGVAAHEFGHNLGLWHANYWQTGGAAGPPNPNAPQPNFPSDPTSLVFRDDVNAPGDTSTAPKNPPGDIEYGDPFDTMGSAGAGIFQFSAHAKWQLNWLAERYVRTITQTETNRLYAFDAPLQSTGRLYALRIQKDFERTYWIDHRSLWTANPWQSRGVELHWNDWSGTAGTSQLVDSTPGSPNGKNDCAIVVGRTYADPQSAMFITPVAKGGSGANEYIDVVVNLGTDPANLAPSVALSADVTSIPVGGTVSFNVSANDANGDSVAYYWDFGDNTFGLNASSASHQFATAGKYVVRCEVSDMKGGVGSAWVVITVGTSSNYVITGSLIDDVGNPLPNSRVHNSGTGAAYRVGWSDSQGNFAIGNVPPGNYHIYPFEYGAKPLRFFENPVQVVASDVGGLDAMQQIFPHVSITALNDAEEGSLTSGQFEISRTGSTANDLRVFYTSSGTAVSNVNYEPLALVTIPAGSASTILNVTPITNSVADGPLSVTVTLRLATVQTQIVSVVTNISGTNVVVTRTNQITFPGWELLPVNGQLTWFQTYPIQYVLGTAEATLNIQDDDVPAGPPSVGIFAFDDTAVETGEDSAELLVMRNGSVANDLTVYYTVEPGPEFPGSVEDYIPVTGQVTIPAGQNYAFVPIIARNDLFVEGNETLVVRLTPRPEYAISSAHATAEVLIVDDDLPVVTVNATDAIASEPSANTGTFTFVRAGDFSGNLIVNYLVTGTATSGVDFQTLPGQVVIPAGQVSATVTVVPIEDGITEGNETVTVLISESSVYNIGNPNDATLTIQDNELPTVTLAVTDGSAGEPANTGTYTLTRTAPSNATLVVNFLVGGTAIEQADYGSIGTNVTFAAGSNTTIITINPINENYRETEESVIVRLMPGANYNLDTNNTTGTISFSDDDGSNKQAVGFVLKSLSVLESVGVVHIPVRTSVADTDARPTAIVEWHITGGSAVQGVDYFLSSTGYLAFATNGPPNDPKTVPVVTNLDVMVINRPDVQAARTLVITLFDPQLIVTNLIRSNNVVIGSNTVAVTTNAFLGAYRVFTLTIGDDDTNIVTVAATTPLAREAGAVPGQFTLTRTGPTNRAVTVIYSLTGTASSRTDFAPLGNQIVIPAGTNAARITIMPVDDGTEESVETLQIRLISCVNGQIGFPDTATVRIVDNDGTIQFSLADYHVNEDATNAVLHVVRTGATNLTTSVEYLFTGGTAINGVDYFGTNGTLSFPPGVTERFITVPLVDDALVEPDESVTLVLSNATGGVPLGGQSSATLFIVNDDTEFVFAASSYRGNENGGFGTVEILRRGVLTNTDSVTFQAFTNTASTTDFAVTSLPLVFAPGAINQIVSFAINDDILFEGDETAALSLTNPSLGTILGAVSNANFVIVDDECKIDFQSAGFSVKEYSNFVTVVIRRTGGTVNPISVNYSTANGTATNGLDYVGGTGTIYFAGDHYVLDTNGSGTSIFVPGDSVRTLDIGIIADTLGEGNETFTVTLDSPDGGFASLPGSTLLGTNATTIVTILDDELPGSVDYEFNPGTGANGVVRSVAISPRGGLVEFQDRVVFGGDFTTVDGVAFNHVARLLPNGLLDTGFNPGAGANSNISVVAVQSDGRVLVGGDFTQFNNTNRLRLARLNADGKLDLSFDLGTNGVDNTVRALALQTNGQVLIAGDFTAVSGQTRTRVARLHPNGALDTNFAATINGSVNALAIQADGKILVGGSFSLVNGSPRVSLARLTTSGALDGSFVVGTGFNGPVNGLAVQVDGQILVGGSFTNYNGSNALNLVRLDAAGVLDPTFQTGTGPDAAVASVAVSPNGKIVIGGAFTHFNGTPRARFARLNAGGTLDSVFNIGTGANDVVRSVAVQPDTAVLIGGDFTAVNDLPRNHIARIHGDEKLEITGVEFFASTFFINENGGSATITVTRTGNTNRAFSVQFRTEDGTASSSAPQDYEENTGTLTFAAGELSKTFDVMVFDDLLVEGNETVNLFLTNASPGIDLSGTTAAVLVIIDSAKTVSFSTGTFTVGEGGTNALITLARGGNLSGEVMITFSTHNGTAAAGYDYTGITNTVTFTNGQAVATVLVPISDDNQPEYAETVLLQVSAPGTAAPVSPATAVLSIIDNDPGPGGADTTFDPGAGATRFVRALALQPDGRLLVGGAFTNFASSNLNYLARLRTNGLVDPSFTPGTGPNALVSGIGLSADGHIAIGGTFSTYNGSSFNRVVRLTTNGIPDASFNQPMGFDAAINGLASQGDGKILAGGAFHTPASGLARLRVNGTFDLQFDPGTGADAAVHAVSLEADGKVLIGGAFTNVAGFPRPRLARLGTNGILDGTFPSLGITNGNIYAIAPAPGGKILIGGSFRYVQGAARSGVARLNGDGSLDLSFNPGSGVVGTVYTVCALTNGAVFIGGDFVTCNGASRLRYALLKSDGSVDPFFDATVGADNTVYASVVTPEQTIVIGGDFTTVGGVARKGVARLSMGDPTVIRVLGPQVAGDQAVLSINTSPGRAYVLEGCSDLLYWLPLQTNVATGVTLDFADPGVSGHGYRFYRARRFGP